MHRVRSGGRRKSTEFSTLKGLIVRLSGQAGRFVTGPIVTCAVMDRLWRQPSNCDIPQRQACNAVIAAMSRQISQEFVRDT